MPLKIISCNVTLGDILKRDRTKSISYSVLDKPEIFVFPIQSNTPLSEPASESVTSCFSNGYPLSSASASAPSYWKERRGAGRGGRTYRIRIGKANIVNLVRISSNSTAEMRTIVPSLRTETLGMHIPGGRAPLKLGAIFFQDETLVPWLRNSHVERRS